MARALFDGVAQRFAKLRGAGHVEFAVHCQDDHIAVVLPLDAHADERLVAGVSGHVGVGKDKAGEWKAADSAAGLGRIADNGETVTFSTNEAYATATDHLFARDAGDQGSAVVLYALNDKKTIEARAGAAPRRSTGSAWTSSPDPNNKTISADCREAALDVAGKGPGGGPEKLTITEGGRLVEVEGEKVDASDAAVRALLIDKKVHETPNYATLDDAARKSSPRTLESDVSGMRRQDRENVRATAVSDDRARRSASIFTQIPGVATRSRQ